MMQWISVKDRLPEADQIVLAVLDNEHAEQRVLPCFFREGRFNRYFDYCESDNVMSLYYTRITHWVPFPAPPNDQPAFDSVQFARDHAGQPENK